MPGAWCLVPGAWCVITDRLAPIGLIGLIGRISPADGNHRAAWRAAGFEAVGRRRPAFVSGELRPAQRREPGQIHSYGGPVEPSEYLVRRQVENVTPIFQPPRRSQSCRPLRPSPCPRLLWFSPELSRRFPQSSDDSILASWALRP